MRPPSGLTVRESPRAVHAQSPPLIDLSGLSDGKSLPDILHLLERRLTQLEDVVLPSYLAERRWFGRKDQALSACRVACISRLTAIDPAIALCEVDTMVERPAGHTAERCVLPLAIAWASPVAP